MIQHLDVLSMQLLCTFDPPVLFAWRNPLHFLLFLHISSAQLSIFLSPFRGHQPYRVFRGPLSRLLYVPPLGCHSASCITFFNYEKVLRSVMSDSRWPHGVYPTKLLCPWNSSGKNTGVGCHSLLQGIFLTQGSNPSLLQCRQITVWTTREAP